MITLESLMTAAGAGVAAVVIGSLVELLKRVLPALDARVSGASMAFALSAVLYIWAALTKMPADFNAQMALLIAWLTCAIAAVGAYAVTSHAAVQAGLAALKDPKTASKAVEQVQQTMGSEVVVETVPE